MNDDKRQEMAEDAAREAMCSSDDMEVCCHCNGSGEGICEGIKCDECFGTGETPL